MEQAVHKVNYTFRTKVVEAFKDDKGAWREKGSEIFKAINQKTSSIIPLLSACKLKKSLLVGQTMGRIRRRENKEGTARNAKVVWII